MAKPSSESTFGNSIWGQPHVQAALEPPVLQVEPLFQQAEHPQHPEQQ